MRKPLAAAAAILALGLLADPLMAQSPPQTAALIKLDTTKLASGYRASKIIGGVVINEANESVGKVDELLIGPDGRTPYAVLSVGGFLGLGDRLVVVPYDSLKMAANKIMLPGATKEALKALPEFRYARS
ncbi:MAG: PRC-barrel domain-containing protein [Rhodospirillaceae bacterium]|nr:PRC-barrel domain-containing protein [Rhodospirillaceae bacterium]